MPQIVLSMLIILHLVPGEFGLAAAGPTAIAVDRLQRHVGDGGGRPAKTTAKRLGLEGSVAGSRRERWKQCRKWAWRTVGAGETQTWNDYCTEIPTGS